MPTCGTTSWRPSPPTSRVRDAAAGLASPASPSARRSPSSAPLAQRSGPSGSVCTVLDEGVGADEIVLMAQSGTDGGLVVGRVGTESAATVEVELPGPGGVVTARAAGPERFFVADVSARAVRPLWSGAAPTATARDADGAIVARSVPTATQSVPPISLPGDRPAPGSPSRAG